MNARHPDRRRSAFTLIEIILAMAIAALVLLAVQGVFFNALRLRNTTDQQIADAAELQHALDIITADLRALHAGTGAFAEPLQTNSLLGGVTTSGIPVGPTFTTTSGRSDAYGPFADLQRVTYLLVPSTGSDRGAQTLVRSVERNLLSTVAEEPELQPLLDDVVSAEVEFCDGTSWTSTWDAETSASLPTAIRFRLLRRTATGPTAGDPVEIVVPVLPAMAVSLTTS